MLGGVHTGAISIDQPGMCVRWYTQDPPVWEVCTLVHSGSTSLGGLHNGTMRIDHPWKCAQWYNKD